MSLFDTIRYPITIVFRIEDLQRIPNDILWDWIKKDLKVEMIPHPNQVYRHMVGIHNFIKVAPTSYRETQLKSLQRRIEEYEPIRYNQIPNRY